MRIAIDCDDAAFDFKDAIYEYLKGEGYDITDLKYSADHDCDYPDIALNLAERVAEGAYDRGILICGTGLGVAMMANKVPGAYAGTVHDCFAAQRLAKSNDANIITMGARCIGVELGKLIVKNYFESTFAGGGSAPKVSRMRELEKKYMK